MKKVLVAVLLSGFAMSASAGLSKSCEAYFAEIDSFVSAAPAAQQAMLKQQYEASKQQLSALPEAAQEQACSQATEQLTQVKAAMGKYLSFLFFSKTQQLLGLFYGQELRFG